MLKSILYRTWSGHFSYIAIYQGFCTGSIISLLLEPIKSMIFLQHFHNEVVRPEGIQTISLEMVAA